MQKFDASRAAAYEQQSRIALAGYEACHELAACMMSAVLGAGSTRHLLIVGAGGTAQEIVTMAQLEPNWRFTAVDPSPSMLELAVSKLEQADLMDRVEVHLGLVEDLSEEETFDAATMIGVLHHLPGIEAKQSILRSIARRLKPGSPFILAGNQMAYASQPILLKAWGERWRMFGASLDEVTQKLGRILEGADPPASETDLLTYLEDSGFENHTRFFSSLFWGAWISTKR